MDWYLFGTHKSMNNFFFFLNIIPRKFKANLLSAIEYFGFDVRSL